jgi:hypothetical protein
MNHLGVNTKTELRNFTIWKIYTGRMKNMMVQFLEIGTFGPFGSVTFILEEIRDGGIFC